MYSVRLFSVLTYKQILWQNHTTFKIIGWINNFLDAKKNKKTFRYFDVMPMLKIEGTTLMLMLPFVQPLMIWCTLYIY